MTIFKQQFISFPLSTLIQIYVPYVKKVERFRGAHTFVLILHDQSYEKKVWWFVQLKRHFMIVHYDSQ